MDLLRPLLVVTVLASFAAACGTVSVEVTSGSDDGKIDVDRSPGLEPESVSAQGQPPGSSTTSAPLGLLGEGSETTSTSSSTTSVPVTSLPATSVPTSTTSVAPVVETTTTLAPTTTTVAPTIPLEYHQIDYAVFALAGDLEVRMPVSRYETVGFHESGHDGAFQLAVQTIDDWTTLASRGRGTGSRTAADIVVPVGEPVLAPIDGTVIRAGSYTLYCDHTDNFLVIEPTGRPGWELKIFHFDGLAVEVGDQVVAASTLVGSTGRILPFVSQVDEFTAEPSNPHLHIEVIDTSIPDRPSSGGGC